MRRTPEVIPDSNRVFGGLTVKDVPMRAMVRVGRSGMHALLDEHIVNGIDVLRFGVPWPARQELYLGVSEPAYTRLIVKEQNGVDRHPALTGPETTASHIFGGSEHGRSGLTLTGLSESQRAVNTATRKKLIEADVNELAEEIIFDARMLSEQGATAYEACRRAAVGVVGTYLFGVTKSELVEAERLRSTRLDVAVASALTRDVPMTRPLFSIFDRTFPGKEDYCFGEHDFTNTDFTNLIAPAKALGLGAFWLLYRKTQQPQLSPYEVTNRVLTYDTSVSFIVPRAPDIDSSPDTLYSASPYAVLAQRGIEAGIDEEAQKKQLTHIGRIAFGLGGHRCPSGQFTPKLLLALAEQTKGIHLHIAGGVPKINPRKLLLRTPHRKTQGHLNFL
jgi:hypothetical protein